jgi:hypothetical protein
MATDAQRHRDLSQQVILCVSVSLWLDQRPGYTVFLYDVASGFSRTSKVRLKADTTYGSKVR